MLIRTFARESTAAHPSAVDGGSDDENVVASTERAAAIKAERVSKRFAAHQALSSVSMAVAPGEARALVGRNGAGKSTLVAVLTGLIRPDSGSVAFHGSPAPRPEEREKWRQRVACVYQKSTLLPALSVAENLMLNQQPRTRGGLVSWREMRHRAQEALASWEVEVNVSHEAGTLSVEQRQIVEIGRALLQGARILILDEPTAELDGREIAKLFERLRTLREREITLIYISHQLDEIYEVCDTATVLRDGTLVVTAPVNELPYQKLAEYMVGDAGAVEGRTRNNAVSRQTTQAGEEPLLVLQDIEIGHLVRGVSLYVREGEIVGLAGLAGSGRDEIAEAIVGMRRFRRGRAKLRGATLGGDGIPGAKSAGVGFVPRDRHRAGLVPELTVGENLTLTIADEFGPLGFISPRRQRQRAEALVAELQIVTTGVDQHVRDLSGGNQQKIVIGRALAIAPKLLVLLGPTQGVDIAAREAIFQIIDSARSRGSGALVVSDEMDELAICDRIYVVFRGKVTAEFTGKTDRNELIRAIEGVGSDSPIGGAE